MASNNRIEYIKRCDGLPKQGEIAMNALLCAAIPQLDTSQAVLKEYGLEYWWDSEKVPLDDLYEVQHVLYEGNKHVMLALVSLMLYQRTGHEGETAK